MSEKTEKPSPQRLRQAREQGQFPRSRLLSGAAVTFGAMLGVVGVAPFAQARLLQGTARLFSGELSLDAAGSEALSLFLWMAVPPLVGAMLASTVVSVAFAGFEAHPELLAPKLERISIAAGFKRLFSIRQWLDLLKALLVMAVMLWVGWGYLEDHASAVLGSIRLEGTAGIAFVLGLAPGLVLRGVAVLLVLGLADFMLARHRHLQDNRMSREDLKREHKESEGDPHSKGKRKQLHRSLAQGGPARGVQKATAIVVNPTHIAVAIRYSPEECDAPYLVAKGREEDALKIRQEAKRLGIPVIKDIPLARSLVHYDVGEEVPEELYKAAAAVLKIALQQSDADSRPGSETP